MQRSVARRALAVTGDCDVRDRISQQQQRSAIGISAWSTTRRVGIRRCAKPLIETLQVIDQAVNDSFNELNRNPHDEVSEEMLNAALNEKLALLKEFSDL